MRIGLYGMPTAGKSYILNQVDFAETVNGGEKLREIDPDFDKRDEEGKKKAREKLAILQSYKDSFLMDGHYAFGDKVVFTDKDGDLYDAFVYIYSNPNELRKRMDSSKKNRKYLEYDLDGWQEKEIGGLRSYCHEHCKDFYVVDVLDESGYISSDLIMDFLKDLMNGFSCLGFAQKCVDDICENTYGDAVILFDGDRTLIKEDSSVLYFDYSTHIFDGNRYTGFQYWMQKREFTEYDIPEDLDIKITYNDKVYSRLGENSYILTSGHPIIWKKISRDMGLSCYCGGEMSADTKFFVTRLLQNIGMHVSAYGDSLNDYYMLKQADLGYLVKREDGSLSRSLKNANLEGLILV